jgi:hypothetical protein
MLTDVTQIPSIGCFRLSPGHRASGDFTGHALTVHVDAQGEACDVDGAAFSCSGCIGAPKVGCSAMLWIPSRDPDGTINFVVQKLVGYSYANNQETFDSLRKDMEARAQQPAVNPGAGLAAAPVPDGPYASWPEESKKNAVAVLSFRCLIISGMQLANYRGVQEAAHEMAQAMILACVDHQMPDDWPDRSYYQATERTHYERARALDPGLSLPSDDVWREVAKKLKEKAGPPAVTRP